MCAFQCDNCFHKQVCTDEPNTRALNEECALYANVKNFTDVQQLQAKIRAIVIETVEAQNGNCDAGEILSDLVADLRVLSAM